MSMDESTLEALKGSIAKWEGIVAGTEKDRGATNCPLCRMFNKEELDEPCERDDEGDPIDACVGCPVRAFTGKDWCYDTPYVAYADARWKQKSGSAMQTHAQAELDFLKSLLPKESV